MATSPNSTRQPNATEAPVQTGVADVRLLFAQLKVEFSRLHIKQPLVFIQWKRPDLSTDEIRRIRMGLSGRAAGADGHLAKVVTAVLDELKAA